MIFKGVREGKPYPDHGLSYKDWSQIPPQQIRLDELVTTTTVLALFIDGQPLQPESRHTQLYAKYRRRLNEVRAGRARMGIEPASGREIGRRESKDVRATGSE